MKYGLIRLLLDRFPCCDPYSDCDHNGEIAAADFEGNAVASAEQES
jgi:hypothetical protein